MEISIDLRFPRDAASVPAVRRLLDASLDVLGVEEPIRGDIRLMLTEACGNVVQHAQAADAYTVRVQIMDERCVIKVIDHGRGFDPATITVTKASRSVDGTEFPVTAESASMGDHETADPLSAAEREAAAEPAEHGRGLLIMESLADEVRLSSLPEPEHGALVALEKRLHYGGDTLGSRLAGPSDDAGP